MIEKCEHDSCGFENRLLYCETEALDVANAEIVADVVDELLFESREVTSGHYSHRNTRSSGISERVFSFLSADGGKLPELQVWLRHERKKGIKANIYDIAIARRESTIAGEGTSWQSSNYSIEIYPLGKVYGTIDRVNPVVTPTGKLQAGTAVDMMSVYDYEQLFDELAEVCRLHDIEKEDNLNCLRVSSRLE